MSMYVVQVKPGTDLQAAVLLRKRGHLVRCPQRTMDIRKNGKSTGRSMTAWYSQTA